MPSQLHEALLLLFRNRPELAPELLRDALHQELPPYSEARIESAELTELQPAEYRADLVVLLYEGKPAAMQASAGLDADRAVLYVDLVLASLSHAAKEALRTMDPAKYQFQSDFAKHYIEQGRVEGEARGRAEGEARGRAEGEARGRAATLIKLLAFKNLGPLDEVTLARIHAGTVEELELWAVRVLTALSLEDVFGA